MTMLMTAPAQPLSAADRLAALAAIEAELKRRYGNLEIDATAMAATLETAKVARTDALVAMATRLRLCNAGVRVAPAGRRLTRRERYQGGQYGSGVRATAA